MRRFLVEAVPDVLGDGQRIEERHLLEHHADVGAQPHEVALRHLVSIRSPWTENRAGVGAKQAENQLEDDRLAGAAGAEQERHAPLAGR